MAQNVAKYMDNFGKEFCCQVLLKKRPILVTAILGRIIV